MSSDEEKTEQSGSTEVLYKTQDEVSIESSSDEWTPVVQESAYTNPKKALYEAGLYNPGSAEVCAKSIAMSTSSVLIHPYYNYPAVHDPGIKEALLKPEEKVVYPNDGQDLYLAVCAEMNQCPVTIFHKQLLQDNVNLSYYGVNPYGVRAMALALQHNRNVTVLNFTDNFLNDDACFHLSQMLISNTALKELTLSGCRIGPSGVKFLFSSLSMNRALKHLNLNTNMLGDEGIQYLAESVIRGLDVSELDLSNNNLTGYAGRTLSEAFEIRNRFSYINLSWNNLCAPFQGVCALLNQLSESECLKVLNISWNALSGERVGEAIKQVMRAPKIQTLDVSNNKLSDEAISSITESMDVAANMTTLNLSYNPLSIDDTLKVIVKMKKRSVKICNLLMENIFVNEIFLHHLMQVKNMPSKKNVIVTYGGVRDSSKPLQPDMRKLLLKRVDFLTSKSKKQRVDIALVAMQLLKDNNFVMGAKNFAAALEEAGMNLDDDLVNAIIDNFAGSKPSKSKTIDIQLLVDYMKRLWPDRKLPPTPPPEPEVTPEPDPPVAEKRKKKKT